MLLPDSTLHGSTDLKELLYMKQHSKQDKLNGQLQANKACYIANLQYTLCKLRANSEKLGTLK